MVLLVAVAAVQAGIESPQAPLPYAYHQSHAEAADQEAHESNETPGTYLQHYGNGPEGYKIQSGFEGYLVPAMATAYGLSHMNHGYAATALAHIQPLLTKLVEIVPKVSYGFLFFNLRNLVFGLDWHCIAHGCAAPRYRHIADFLHLCVHPRLSHVVYGCEPDRRKHAGSHHSGSRR